MTRFLDVSAVSGLIQAIGIKQSIAEIAGYIVDDFRRWEQFIKSARTANHSPSGVIELMPASDDTLYGFKYVNGHPKNIERGLSTVMAFGVLSEVETGQPLLLGDLTLLTALRTAAMSAAAAKVLAREDSQTMAVIGCGSQSEFQILAFKAMLGIKTFYLYDIDSEAIDKLRNNLSEEGISLIPTSSIRDAVSRADIITTITADKTNATILTPDIVTPGMHINAVGGDCPGKTELHRDILAAARVIVEYEPQTRVEGDIQQMPPDFPVVEFWEIATGLKVGRQNERQITVFDSVGFALEDFSTLRFLRDKAEKYDVGIHIDLVPSLRNPKDLYSLVRGIPMPLIPIATRGAEKVIANFDLNRN
jgi:ornithine cyclodeaminase